MKERLRSFFHFLILAAIAISTTAGVHQCVKIFLKEKAETTLSSENRKESHPVQNEIACSFSPVVAPEKTENDLVLIPQPAKRFFPPLSFHPQHYTSPPFSPPQQAG